MTQRYIMQYEDGETYWWAHEVRNGRFCVSETDLSLAYICDADEYGLIHKADKKINLLFPIEFLS